ncbi:hypothetical protein FB567DRAFT_585068 [Paraphoma chrysanthemicola]|uniref:Uncharacterized protein n=1 Tax=Paraphoma chrysanthemicola TaxID=798071 RepID=A0A8K0VRS0_9PLEO|nr:hypothetical protein FB567DRAFT_585068 [Paraphoma chrysanthemicola]
MVPSPRKRAPRSPFRQTWDETDAAFLDPNSLPVARIPRGWERKQETKKTEEGKDKKIWRRFNLRSRASDTTEEQDEEEHDVRSRAVKKRQHMSPKAMEKTASRLNGRKRAFKATRWDRRKSVLPRKKISSTEQAAMDAADSADESDDANTTRESGMDESIAELDTTNDAASARSTLPTNDDRRGTFTFHMDAETVEDLPDYESLDGLGGVDEPFPGEDATIAQFFRSPVKKSSVYTFGSPEKIEYPTLPHITSSTNEFDQSETVIDIAVGNGDEELTEMGGDFENDMGHESSHMIENAPQAADVKNSQVAVTTESAMGGERAGTTTTSTDISYPILPGEVLMSDPAEPELPSPGQSIGEPALEAAKLGDQISADAVQLSAPDLEDHVMTDDAEPDSAEDEFTEASLQLNIQRDCDETVQEEQVTVASPSKDQTQSASGESIGPESEVNTDDVQESEAEVQQEQHDDLYHESRSEKHIEDITDGLTLSFGSSKVASREPTPRKLHSPPPPPVQSGMDDATMTIALDDDTALLKDFINRAAASKAEKAAVLTHRRESLQNRRDSDVIRHALASPRKALEDKDTNSPSKYDTELTLDLSQTLTLSMPTEGSISPTPGQDDQEGTAEERSLRGSRRSSRAKKSRLPAPASAAQVQKSKIAIRRADGNEHVVLKKSDAQELATLTRANTRKNKQGAFNVTVRLLKLAVDADKLPPVDDSTREIVLGKNIRWDEQLAYYQENPETVAEAESLATPDELSMEDASAPTAKKSKISKSSTPKIRRVRGLGTANGTPGKGLLAPASLLPEDVQTERETAAPAQQLPRPKASKVKKMPVASTTATPALSATESKLPTLDVIPVGVEPTKERKSRLAAPRKVTLPQPTASLAVEGKENAQRTGISGATPKKGIPAPKVIIPPSVGMESGLPRRRGRKI